MAMRIPPGMVTQSNGYRLRGPVEVRHLEVDLAWGAREWFESVPGSPSRLDALGLHGKSTDIRYFSRVNRVKRPSATTLARDMAAGSLRVDSLPAP